MDIWLLWPWHFFSLGLIMAIAIFELVSVPQFAEASVLRSIFVYSWNHCAISRCWLGMGTKKKGGK